ncbi:uncharacterized protein A4U43_C03F11040 [Asparagus officinalis]|uniref:Uncharacterized protein n=1 Tax=Asparagus officinalis TaxID=4686 RepID=A0A5P1FBT5_ASPOF|nr:uncharacterized protein A4U43_C03F11040 [Asparagus officinalis]
MAPCGWLLCRVVNDPLLNSTASAPPSPPSRPHRRPVDPRKCDLPPEGCVYPDTALSDTDAEGSGPRKRGPALQVIVIVRGEVELGDVDGDRVFDASGDEFLLAAVPRRAPAAAAGGGVHDELAAVAVRRDMYRRDHFSH